MVKQEVANVQNCFAGTLPKHKIEREITYSFSCRIVLVADNLEQSHDYYLADLCYLLITGKRTI